MEFNTFLGLVYLFILGSLVGWFIELIFRNTIHKSEKLINPGFLNGPYLPLYGTGTIILYAISDLNINIFLRAVLIIILMTLIELVTGLFFEKYYNVRLWDYSKEKWNYKGLICPLFSFFWGCLGMGFYLFIYPILHSKILIILYSTQASFVLGMLCSVIILDIIFSLNLVNKLKKEVQEIEEKLIINYNLLKREILKKEHTINKPNFLLHFKGISIKEEIKKYIAIHKKG